MRTVAADECLGIRGHGLMTALPFADEEDVEVELFPSAEDLCRHRLGEAGAILNQGLADCIDLGLQCRQSYRSLPRDDAFGVRDLAAQIASELDACADQIGERLLVVGGVPEGTVRAVAFRSQLMAFDLSARSPDDLAELLAQGIAQFVRTVRAGTLDIAERGDAESARVFERIARIMETRWTLLEATLGGVPWPGP